MAFVAVEITSMSGDVIRMSVEPDSTLGELKARLETDLGLPRQYQKLLAGSQEVQDTTAVVDVTNPAGANACREGTVGRSPVLLTLVQLRMQPEDFKLSQTDRDGGCGATDYLVVVTHIPTGTFCEHEYCCYHPMAGSVKPDPLTGLRVDAAGRELIVQWEWSENSYDMASAGSIFRRPISMQNGRLVWAGSCTSERRVRATNARPPPECGARPLPFNDEIVVQELTYHVNDEDELVFKHGPSGSTVEYSGSAAEFKSYQKAAFTQAGGYVRFECLVRWSESGQKGASFCNVFLRMRDGRLALA